MHNCKNRHTILLSLNIFENQLYNDNLNLKFINKKCYTFDNTISLELVILSQNVLFLPICLNEI